MELSKEFLKNYENKKPPFTEIGLFTYLRTYSRWIESENRNETWLETCKRVVNWNFNLDANPDKNEMEMMFDNMFNLRQFPSGRTLWVGGTEIADEYPLSNFNCAFQIIESIDDFADLIYLSMLGAGVGNGISKQYVSKLPKFRKDIKLKSFYSDKFKTDNRQELSYFTIDNDTILIIVGDSKEGWRQALKHYLEIMTSNDYKTVKNIVINYSYIRPHGTPLKRFGGTASGYKSLMKMFEKIHNVINESNGYLEPIHILDICTIIGENVVSGGVRRTAESFIFDSNDNNVRTAKTNLYEQTKDNFGNDVWIKNESISHRELSNNSIGYYEKPSKQTLIDNFNELRYSGEPAFVNMKEALRRASYMKGMNP